MKILTILGSPKKNGNTARVLGMFEGLVADGHDVDRLNIADVEVAGCVGCYACQEHPDEAFCAQKDDAQGIYDRILTADAVVYAAPLYMWGFPAGIHALLERHLALVTGYSGPNYKSLIEGKRVALLVTSGGPVENNAELIQAVFDRLADWGQVDVVGKYMVPDCTTPDALPAAAEIAAKKMAEDLTR